MLSKKITNLVTKLSNDLFERDDALRLSLLALLAGESIFFLGPPGVAKSLISRQIKSAIVGARNFEYLMNRFSTPEEIFGPISLKKLDEDKYERKVEGYLPAVDIAFLDEIWKASPSIQNTLLTIINEKLFRNGSNDLKVPLQLLIAASNELPAAGEGLEALYDRFLIRVFVDNLSNNENFLEMIIGNDEVNSGLTKQEIFTIDEILKIRKDLYNVSVSRAVGEFIIDLKKQLKLQLEERAPYISDRRWKKIIKLLRASAIAADRKEVSFIDLLLIPNFIWENNDHILEINEIFNETWYKHAIAQFGFSIDHIHTTLEKFSLAVEEATNRRSSKIEYQEYMTVQLRDVSQNVMDYLVFNTVNEHPHHRYIAFPVEKVDEEWTPKQSTTKLENFYLKRTDTSTWLSQTFIPKDYFVVNGAFYYKNMILKPVVKEDVQIDKYKHSTDKIRDIYRDFTKLEPLINKVQGDLEVMMKSLNDVSAPLVPDISTRIEALDRYLGVELRKVITKKTDLLTQIIDSKAIDIEEENIKIANERSMKASSVQDDTYELVYTKPKVEEMVDDEEEYFTHWDSYEIVNDVVPTTTSNSKKTKNKEVEQQQVEEQFVEEIVEEPIQQKKPKKK